VTLAVVNESVSTRAVVDVDVSAVVNVIFPAESVTRVVEAGLFLPLVAITTDLFAQAAPYSSFTVAVIAIAAPGAAINDEVGENVNEPFAVPRATDANVFVTAVATPRVVVAAAGIATVNIGSLAAPGTAALAA